MNAEEILTEVYWDLSTLDGDQIKYPDHGTLIKQLKKYMNSRYGTIIAKEGKMAGFFNEQAREWYKNNTDLLSVIEKLTNRCKKLEEENTHLKDEVKTAVSREEVTKKNLEYRTHEITDLNNCLSKKNAKIKELRCKVTGNDLDIKAIYTSLGVDGIKSALDKIHHMKTIIKQNEEDSYLIDQQRKKDADSYALLAKYVLEATHAHTIKEALNIFKNFPSYPITGMIDIRFYREAREENNQLRKKVEELQTSYDNCVNECSDHIIEIDSLLQNLEVETVEEALDKIRLIKRDGVFITMDFDSELRVENEKLKKKVEDLRKDVKFEFDHRMAVLAASVDQDTKIAELKETIEELKHKDMARTNEFMEAMEKKGQLEDENARLKNFINDSAKEIHSMTEEIEKRLAKYREEKNND